MCHALERMCQHVIISGDGEKNQYVATCICGIILY